MILAVILSVAASIAGNPAGLWEPELIGASTERVQALVPQAEAKPLKANPQTALRAKGVEIEGIPFTALFIFYKDRLNRASLETEFPKGDVDGDITRVQTLVARIEETRGKGRCIDGRKGERFDGKIDTGLRDAGFITYLCIWKTPETNLELNYLAVGTSPPRLQVVLRDPKADARIYEDWRSATPAAPSSEP